MKWMLIPLALVVLNACEEVEPPTPAEIVPQAQELPVYDQDATLVPEFNEVDSSQMLPPPTGWVNDRDYIFTETDRTQLDAQIQQHFEETGNSIYVVTLPTPDPFRSLEDYAVALGNSWNPEPDTTRTFIIITMCTECQEVKVNTFDAYDSNYGDDKSPDVIYGTMFPAFAEGNFVGGLTLGVEQTIAYNNLIHARRNQSAHQD